MKKTILAIAVLSALPVIAFAAEQAAAPAAAPEKHHSMQNSDPTPESAVDAVKEEVQAAPEHVMKNSTPSPKQAVDAVKEKVPAPEHVMKNN